MIAKMQEIFDIPREIAKERAIGSFRTI